MHVGMRILTLSTWRYIATHMPKVLHTSKYDKHQVNEISVKYYLKNTTTCYTRTCMLSSTSSRAKFTSSSISTITADTNTTAASAVCYCSVTVTVISNSSFYYSTTISI